MTFKPSTSRIVGRFVDSKREILISHYWDELTICERDLKSGDVISVNRAELSKHYTPLFNGDVYVGEAIGKRGISEERVCKRIFTHYNRHENSVEINDFSIENPDLHPIHASKLLGYMLLQFVNCDGEECVLVRCLLLQNICTITNKNIEHSIFFVFHLI